MLSAGYGLYSRLHVACFESAEHGCIHACDQLMASGLDACAEAVYECLNRNRYQQVSLACKNEISQLLKETVVGGDLETPLQLPCKSELQTFCHKVSVDHGRSLACLRNNRASLSAQCKASELRFSAM